MNIQLIELELQRLPNAIRQANDSYIEARAEVERKKLEYAVAKSNSLVKAKATNATEKTAIAVSATKNEAEALIGAELEMARADNEKNYLENQFTAVRKLASIYTEQIKSNLGGF